MKGRGRSPSKGSYYRRDKHKDDRANKIYTCEKFLIEDTDPKENFELNTNLSQNLKTYVSSTLNAKNW